MATDDSDITLGPGKLLGLFFMLVAICGVFFAIGYSLGKTSAREQAMNDKAAVNASLGPPAVTESSVAKPSGVVATKNEPQATASEDQQDPKPGTSMTFYNAVKKSDGAAQRDATGSSDSSSSKPSAAQSADRRASGNAVPAESNPGKALPVVKSEAVVASKATTTADVKPLAAATAGAYVVQIAAVTREEDAAALAGALRKKSYNVFVVNNPAVHDKLYHVQVGPFSSMQDADAMKAKLTAEGYNPIVKRS
jgi:DedD protein